MPLIDQMPSPEPYAINAQGRDLVWALAVRGQGVLLIRMSSKLTDRMGRCAVGSGAILTSGEIGWSPRLL